MSNDFRRGMIAGAMIVAALFVSLVACSSAQTWLVGSGVALHLDGAHHCNWFTKGAGIEHNIAGNWRLAAGVYDNSNCNMSVYAAAAWLPLSYGSLRFGLIGGAVTGYRASVTPAGGIVTGYERRRWGVNAILIPPSGESGSGVLWLQVKRAF